MKNARPKGLSMKNTRAKAKPAGNLSIGIDLGGTKIATGLVNNQGRILSEDRRPTKAPNHDELPPKKQIQFLIDSMADAVLEIVQSQKGKTLRDRAKNIRGVGLASAGPLHVEKGTLERPFNMGDWGRVPIVSLLTKALKKRGLNFKVHFQNDAIAAALGEGWVGAAKNCVSYAMITLGTGIGTGVILNGKPCQSRGMGSEWGHIIVDQDYAVKNPSDIYHGTLEGLASGTGMFKLAQSMGYKGESSVDLAESARAGDKIALEVFKRASHALATAFYNLSIGTNLDKFAVTGGMLPVQDLFVPQAVALYTKMMTDSFKEFLAPVVISKMGNKAGIIGAARLPFLDS
jgi:glucokinase